MLFTRLTAKMLLLAVLLIAPAACSLTNDDDNSGGDRPTPIPTSFVMTTPTVLVVTATPAPTTAPQPTSVPQPTQVNVPPCTIPAGWVPYRVAAGDTLSNIARRAVTTADQLARGNCLANPNNITVGQVLYVPLAIVNTPVPQPTTAICSPSPRLIVGSQGRVLPGTANALRSLPGRGGTSVVIAEIPGGGVFNVLAGPQCADGFYWWQVNYNGVIGWTAEGQGNTYWTEPQVACTLPTLLQAGRTGRVTPGAPNSLRSQPGRGFPSVVIGEIPGSGMFRVIQGPQCVEGFNWWQVNYNGLIGWTAEGQAGTYWTEPLKCAHSLVSQLLPNTVGRVTPGTPNRLRLTPGSTGAVVGEIPGGSTFSIVGGPQCGSEGWLWWQVNYNGTIGWTAEGDTSTYWLEPVF